MHGCGAQDDRGLKAVDNAPLEQLPQPLPSGAKGRERAAGDLAGGQHAVLVQHPDDPLIPGREPPGERGLMVDRVRHARGGACGLEAAAQRTLAGGVGDHDDVPPGVETGTVGPPRRVTGRGE